MIERVKSKELSSRKFSYSNCYLFISIFILFHFFSVIFFLRFHPFNGLKFPQLSLSIVFYFPSSFYLLSSFVYFCVFCLPIYSANFCPSVYTMSIFCLYLSILSSLYFLSPSVHVLFLLCLPLYFPYIYLRFSFSHCFVFCFTLLFSF